jgi:hypothetical protein
MATVAVARNQRRSSRLALNASIGLSGHDRDKRSFTTPARATNLNRHGAAIQLSRDLSVGSTVLVSNARGAQVPARVVMQTRAVEGCRTYGVEFMEQDDQANHFWGITFPT